jgi:dihydroflavonol-4-reductase
MGLLGNALDKFGARGPINGDTAWTARLFHWFDCTKAQRELGFTPRPADEALRESVDWMREKGLLK